MPTFAFCDAIARAAGRPVVIERLDFAAKKAELEGRGVGYRRMLSCFAHAAFAEAVAGACARHGVGLVNPAFSSIIGVGLYARRLGLSPHQAAAPVLAWRGLHPIAGGRTRSSSPRRAAPRRPCRFP